LFNLNKMSRKKKNSLFWIIWLILVILWNFGYPEASPTHDVLIAIVLSLLLAGKKI